MKKTRAPSECVFSGMRNLSVRCVITSFNPRPRPAFRSGRCQGIGHAGKNMPCRMSRKGWCIQREFNPVGARVRSPVAWIVGRRETEFRKSIDETIHGMGASHRAVTKVNAQMASKMLTPEAELSVVERRQHGTPQSDRRGETLWRGSSDSTVTRIYQATGEALLAPLRNRRSREPYNRRNREIGERREGDGWVRSSGEAE
jgi:hypothetical protein